MATPPAISVVIVATVRALGVHGRGPEAIVGAALPEEYCTENVDLPRKGCVNLAKHIASAKYYGIPVVVAINKSHTDTEAEVQCIREEAIKSGAEDAVPANHWAEGGKGAVDLTKAVIEASSKPKNFRFPYDTDMAIAEKMEVIVRKMYGGDGIGLSGLAKQQCGTYTRQGFGHLPVCIAKTQYSLSHDPLLKGVPTGSTMPIRGVRLSPGAGYLYVRAADTQTIPGLPTAPGYLNVDVNMETGEIGGLF